MYNMTIINISLDGVLITFLVSMIEHVDEGAQRGEELTTIQPMVSTTPLGKKHSNNIRANEKML